jgi:hypothetical protein
MFEKDFNQALIEVENLNMAQICKTKLDGQNIFSGKNYFFWELIFYFRL